MIGTRRRPQERHIQHVRLDKLTPHPLNAKLYGSAKPDQKLIDSIRMLGIIEPLIVTQRGQIISGHSRWQAAKIICTEDGTSEKTVYLMTMRPDHSPNDAWYTDDARAEEEDNNPLLLERFLIEANRQRVKTPEQIGREFTELKRIEGELAKQRQRRGKAKLPDPADAGQARDKAAAAINMKPRTAEKLEKVVQAADAGNVTARAELDALNSGENNSIHAAFKAVIQPVACACPECEQPFPSRNQLKKHGIQEHGIDSAHISDFLKGRKPATYQENPFDLTGLFFGLDVHVKPVSVEQPGDIGHFHITIRNRTAEQIRAIAEILVANKAEVGIGTPMPNARSAGKIE
jgi:hypothetical protein